MIKTTSKLRTGLSISLAVSLLSGMGLAGASADTMTGLPVQITQAEKAQLQANWTGSLKYSVSPADDAKLKALGFDLNLAESENITNAYNDANDTAVVLFKPKFDVATIKANAPQASLIDFETPRVSDLTGDNYSVGASFRDDDLFWDSKNINTKELQDKPSLQVGQFTTAGAGELGEASGIAPVKDTDGAYASNIFAYPTVTTFEGGVPGDRPNSTGNDSTDGGSILINTKYVDSYLPSENREKDISLNGKQRSLQGEGVTTDIVTNKGQLGVWLQPTLSGMLTDGSGNIGSVAVTDAVFVTIDSTRQKAMSVYTDANHALTTASGHKVWVTPSDATKPQLGSDGVDTAGQMNIYGYNFYDANVDLVSTDAKVLAEYQGDMFAGSFSQAEIQDNGKGGINFVTSYDSSYYLATETLTADTVDTSAEQAKVDTETANVATAQTAYDANKVVLDVAVKAYDKAVADGEDADTIENASWDVDSAQSDLDASESELNTFLSRLDDAKQELKDAQTNGATDYKLTYSKFATNGSNVGDVWSQDGNKLEVGTSWESSDAGYNATFTVTSNANGVLVVSVSLDNAPAVAPTIQSNGATIGTGLSIHGISTMFEAPGYEANYVVGDKPETPGDSTIPKDPETPVETPDDSTIPHEDPQLPEEPVITDDGTIDDDWITDDGKTDDYVETSITDGDTQILATTGTGSNFGMMAWFASLMAGMGGAIIFGRKLHKTTK